MNWNKALKAMRDGKKVSFDKDGLTYFDKQGDHFVCHFQHKKDAWRIWTLDKADMAFFSIVGGWFIVDEVNQ